MAHKKGSGSTKNGRDSNSKKLGVKKYGGEIVKPGQIIVRQRGSKFKLGQNVNQGKDYTIYSIVNGIVHFEVSNKNKRKISVNPN
uniref:Ribosomal protein L27 n=1 Tax=Symphyocladia marchantioides TaxID=88360 RepID=UPI0022FD5CAF|nr:Ribosomal protein L27 [Symphyocladia marchantioides]WAX03798.1 Ribosomal protein L27 [Symphyocladia marchantioides]